MNILWLSHIVPYPPKGGVLQRSYHLLKELSRYNNVTLFAFNQENYLNSFFSSADEAIYESKTHLSDFCDDVQFFKILSEQGVYAKQRLALKSLFSRDCYTINWLKSSAYADAITNYLEKNHVDAVHFDTVSLAPYRHLIGNIPCVLDHHNIESQLLLRRAEIESNLLAKVYYKYEGHRIRGYEEKMCKRFDLNITCSELDSERLRDIEPTLKVTEVPNCVDTEYFVPDYEKQTDDTIVFFGTLDWYPNTLAVEFLALKIWPIVVEKMPSVKAIIIGSNAPQSIIDLARKDKNFTYYGFVDDLRDDINAASVFVCPIKDGGGTKLKMLDAMSMGKAVLADTIACEGIDVNYDKEVVYASTPEEYANEIIRLLSNRAKRISLGQEARTMVENQYSAKAIGEQLNQLFLQVVDSKK